MHKLKQLSFVLAAVCALSTACGQSGTAETTSASAAETKAETTVETTAAVESKAAVASGNETAAEQAIDTVGLVPVSAADLKEGTYDISVESSSSMFKIISCALTVQDGAMTARMTMGGTGYLYVYMGTGEEASKVPESDLISFEENSDGTHSFTVPVETLNEVLPFSKKKEKWYDRELVFEASGIPADAFLNTSLKTVEDLGLADGTYTVEAALTGGSGRASVESPAVVEVKDGKAEATIIWSSSNYDYMRVDEEKFLPVNTEGNSTFVITVTGFDSPLTVYADTTAMSTPHEIEYTLTFDSSTLEEQKQ